MLLCGNCIRDGWETIDEMKNEFIKDVVTILVNYDHLPIRYKFCLDYSIKDCPILSLSQSRGLRTKELGGSHQLGRMVELIDRKG